MSNPQRPDPELVYCHSCENEWFRDNHGLECPECHSDIVEIIDANSDPHAADEPPTHPPHDHLHNHPPWDRGAPDPDEGNIDHVEWDGPGGVHFSRTTYHTAGFPTARGGQAPPPGADMFNGLLGAIVNPIFGGQQRAPSAPPGGGGGGGSNPGSPRVRGQFGYAATTSTNGTRSGAFHFGGGGAPAGPPAGAQPGPQLMDLAGIFGHVLNGMAPGGHGHVIVDDGGPGGPRVVHTTGMGGGMGGPTMMGGPRAPPPLAAMLSAMLNPANARAGDAVFSQEALDRVISQLMEQHGGSTAPGPAAAAAIDALPRVRIAKDHLDAQGKAECSICMDALELGAEVTELPCKHWFHHDCVAAWLREHDTCPQCRRGITPQGGDPNTPRATGQAPRFWQVNPGDFAGLRSPTESSSGRDGAPDSPSDTRHRSRRRSSHRSSASAPGSPSAARQRPSTAERALGGIANWMGRHLGGGNGGSGSGNNGSGGNSSGGGDRGHSGHA